MVPALSLEYSSQSGDGLEGLGWALTGLPSIGRCPRTNAQDHAHGAVNYDANDRFCMEGQRLVAVSSGTYGADGMHYRTEIDGFSDIASVGTASSGSGCTSGSGPAYFVVRTKAGQTMYFGYSEDTDNSGNQSRLSLSSTNCTARAWAVEKIADTKGNYLIVKYTNDMAHGQAYPTEIDYTGNHGASLAPYASVKFVYGVTRNDIIPTYQAGYLQETTVLLTSVQTFVGTTIVTDYKLDYNYAANGLQHDELKSVTQCDSTSPTANCLNPTTFGWQGSRDTLTMTPKANGLSQGTSNYLGQLAAGFWQGSGLTDVETFGASGASPPHPCDILYGTNSTDFVVSGIVANYSEWYRDDDGTYKTQAYSGPPCFPVNYSHHPFEMTGDGFTDILYNQRIALDNYENDFIQNNGAGTLNQSGHYTGKNPEGFGDFDGDGTADYISVWDGYAYEFLSQRDGTYQPWGATFPEGTIFTDTGDFDGDGCTDVLVQATTSFIGYSCGQPQPNTNVPDWSQYEVVTGDFNGDGKTDILVAKKAGGPGTLYLSTGTGLVAQTSFSVPDDWGKYAIVTGDWNGDGKTDLALIASGAGTGYYGVGTDHQIWLSSGTGFTQQTSLNICNQTSCGQTTNDKEAAYVADWNSDGADDIWLKRPKPNGDTEYLFSYVPEMINTVDNGLGIKTTVKYDRLNENGSLYDKCAVGGTSFYCGSAGAYPTQYVDGPIYVVSRIDSGNGLGACAPPTLTYCYSSTYSYAGAQADLQGRGFLGFSKMSVTDIQTDIVQTTTYGTKFPLTGMVLGQTKVYCPVLPCNATAVTLNTTANTYDNIDLGMGTDGVARKFIAIQQSVVASFDLDGTAMPTTTATYTYDCDGGGTSPCAGTTGFGNALTVKVSVSDGSSKTTTNTYANDATYWYLGRLLTASTQSVVPSVPTLTRQTAYCYDLYSNYGTTCPTSTTPTGLLTEEIVEPESSTDPSLKLETDYGYDSYGNKTSAVTKGCVWIKPSPYTCSTTTSTATRETDNQYDSTTYHAQFLTRTTNAAGQFETWEYGAPVNVAFGLASKHTGPNGIATLWGYDTFGRKNLETRPDGNKTVILPTYCTGLPTGVSCPATAQFDVITTPENSSSAQNGPISIVYYDGLSRLIATDVEGFDGTGTGCTLTAPCWIRTSSQYDVNGRLAQTSRPYFKSTGTPQWTVNSFDTIGRVYLTTLPDTSTINYGFHGLTTTVQNAKGQITTTVKNARGLVANVTNDSSKTTNYVYDAFGDLHTVTDPAGNVTTYNYDIRGRKTNAADPDMGGWLYVYDGFGELFQQTDAKSQAVQIYYDKLGRTTERDEPDLTSNWVYDTASGAGKGQLASATTGSNYTRTLTYDTLGRPYTTTNTIDGSAYIYTINYDANGRIYTVTYPSGFVAKYTYTTLGYLQQVTDNTSLQVLWTANSRDAELHLLTQTQGSGVVTTQAFNPYTGLPTSIVAGTSNSIANQSFGFDALGNLTSRTWLNNSGASVQENACYDNLNRLTKTAITTGTDCSAGSAITVTYDPNSLGNITSKSNICSAANCMSYGGGGAGPHALTGITGAFNGYINPTFSYDANGNMVSGAGRTITSTSFNMVSLITDRSNTAALTYGSEHQRLKQVATGSGAGTTYYINDSPSGAMEENFTASGGSSKTVNDYVIADGRMIAQRSCTATAIACTSTVTLTYFVLDHLGSITVITDGGGAVIERLSYDAWGKRRNADGTALVCGALSSSTIRGFTGQEMMDGACFINFNARVYDPSLGRFMSADPVTGTYYNLQILNRYSYVGNNPLSLTDPSGLCFLGCFWNNIIFKAIAAVVVAILAPEVFATIGGILGWTTTSAALAAAVNGGLAGGLAGFITSGNLKGAALGVLQGALFAGAGVELKGAQGFAILGSHEAAAFVTHGLIGGLASSIGGGHFASGFLAGAIGSIGPDPSGDQTFLQTAEGAVEHGVLGGLGSMLGGGKFANGAITGAFAYAASSIAAGDSVEETYKQYVAKLEAAGIDPTNTSVPAGLKAEIDAITGSSEFSGSAQPIYTQDVASGTETAGIQAYVYLNEDMDDPLVFIVPYQGTPVTCSAAASACMGVPAPNSDYGNLLFEWHPHPNNLPGSDLPSEADLVRSLNLGVPGVIWSNTGGSVPKQVDYQAHPLGP